MAAVGPILVAGAAGFIGYHVSRRWLEGGCTVVGIDNLNAYCDPKLKDALLAEFAKYRAFASSGSISPIDELKKLPALCSKAGAELSLGAVQSFREDALSSASSSRSRPRVRPSKFAVKHCDLARPLTVTLGIKTCSPRLPGAVASRQYAC